MKQVIGALVFALLVQAVPLAQRAPTLVSETRAQLAKKDFAGAEKSLRDIQASAGVTPMWLEAFSWMGRAYLAEKNLDKAEAYAREAYKLAAAELKSRPMDQEPRLPIAIGAAIEVLAQVDGQRDARTDALLFLDGEIKTFEGTSIIKRLQKNRNLLSLEGTAAPALVAAYHLGPAPASMADLKGKVVLMFFWAHWCPDCKNMAPALAQLNDTYKDRGFVIVAPSMRYGYVAGGKDATADEETKYIDSIRQASYPVLAGQPIHLSEANHLRYGVSTTPTVVLVDRDGIIRLYHPGQMTLEEMDPLVSKLAGASRTSAAQ